MLKLYYNEKLNDYCKFKYDAWDKAKNVKVFKDRNLNPYATKLGKGVEGNIAEKKKVATSVVRD